MESDHSRMRSRNLFGRGAESEGSADRSLETPIRCPMFSQLYLS